MNLVEQLQVFVRVAEMTSFTQAADSLGRPKASVSTAVQQLEARLGTRLLHRTTRRVQLTQDGQAFYERGRELLSDVDELQAMFQQGGREPLRGRVRIDMSARLAQHAVLPRLPMLLNAHPQLEVELSSTDRRVELVREGFDCVVRAGAVLDTGLVARPLGRMRMVNCASPAYLARHGVPRTLEELAGPAGHRLVHYVPTLGGRPDAFAYLEGDHVREIALPGVLTVNQTDAYEAACIAGLGIVQAPVTGVRGALADGRLVAILPEWSAPPLPLTLLYAHRRQLPGRVRLVMDWLAGVVADHLGEDGAA